MTSHTQAVEPLLVVFTRISLPFRRFLLHCDRVLRPPSHDDVSSALLEDLRGGCLEVLAQDLKLPASVELDQVPGHDPGVGDVANPAPLDVHAVAVLVSVEQADL